MGGKIEFYKAHVFTMCKLGFGLLLALMSQTNHNKNQRHAVTSNTHDFGSVKSKKDLLYPQFLNYFANQPES